MTVPSFQDLPLADRDREWDGAAADKRVREWAGAQDEPNARYRDAHAWYDGEKKQNFTAYKLLIADVVDGRLGGRAPGSHGCGRGDAGLPRRGGPARQRHPAREEPPGAVLRQDGRDRAVGRGVSLELAGSSAAGTVAGTVAPLGAGARTIAEVLEGARSRLRRVTPPGEAHKPSTAPARC